MSNQSPDQSQYQYPGGTAGSHANGQFGQSSAASGGQASSPYAANGYWQQPSASGYGASPYNSATSYGSPYAYNYGAQQPPNQYGQGYAGPYQPGVYGVPPQVQEENTIGTIALILSLGGIGSFFIPFMWVISWLALAAGFVMGIVAVFQPNKKKLTGILAIIFSTVGGILVVLLMILGAWLMSLDSLDTLEQDSSSDFYSSASVSVAASEATFATG